MILDHIEQIELPDDQSSKFADELNTLRYLSVGLSYLNCQVQRIEKQTVGHLPDNVKRLAWGNTGHVPRQTQDLIACSFHWYAVSACNYVWLVGWIGKQLDSDRPKPREYAETVMPEVVQYRHKVAAHLAKVFPRANDTPADLKATMVWPVHMREDGFHTGGWTVTYTTDGKKDTSKIDIDWSLTGVHKTLSARYWPKNTDSGLEKPRGKETRS